MLRQNKSGQIIIRKKISAQNILGQNIFRSRAPGRHHGT